MTNNSAFCPNCGSIVERQQTAYQNSVPAQETFNATPALVFGILSVCFCFTVYFSFLSIIFGAVGKKKADDCLYAIGRYSAKAKTGRILSKVGFIIGIIFTAIATVVIIALLANS